MAEFKDVLENIDCNGNTQKKTYKQVVYLKPKADFRLEREQEFVILRGTGSAQLFRGKNLVCKSFDGINGKVKGPEGFEKDSKLCSECGYKKGIKITDEDGKEVIMKCNSGYTLTLQHADPEKEYSLTMNNESKFNLNGYAKELRKLGLTVDQVVTGITRGESPKTVSTQVFTFRMVRELSIELSEIEKEQLNELISMVKDEGEAVSAMKAKAILMQLPSLKGITEERAARLANMVADENGMITPQAKFV